MKSLFRETEKAKKIIIMMRLNVLKLINPQTFTKL